MSPDDRKKVILSILGLEYLRDYREIDNQAGGTTVFIELSGGETITFAQLERLSQLLKTEHINLLNGDFDAGFSEVTPGVGYIRTIIEAKHCPLSQDKRDLAKWEHSVKLRAASMEAVLKLAGEEEELPSPPMLGDDD